MTPDAIMERHMCDVSAMQRDSVMRPRGTDLATLVSFTDSALKERIRERDEWMKGEWK